MYIFRTEVPKNIQMYVYISGKYTPTKCIFEGVWRAEIYNNGGDGEYTVEVVGGIYAGQT